MHLAASMPRKTEPVFVLGKNKVAFKKESQKHLLNLKRCPWISQNWHFRQLSSKMCRGYWPVCEWLTQIIYHDISTSLFWNKKSHRRYIAQHCLSYIFFFSAFIQARIFKLCQRVVLYMPITIVVLISRKSLRETLKWRHLTKYAYFCKLFLKKMLSSIFFTLPS